MENRLENHALGLAAVAAASSVLILAAAYSRRGKDGESATLKGSRAPPVYKVGIPLLGNFMKFAGDPLEAVRQARKKCGDVFTFPLLSEHVTFLIGPTPHAAFFNATDEDLDQAVSSTPCVVFYFVLTD